jgi:GDPmannose 4,6-dehydratase
MELNWVPTTSFEELIAEMIEKDLDEARRDALSTRHGFSVSSYHE